MAAKYLKGAGGAEVVVLAETEKYYWVEYVQELGEPFTVEKSNENWAVMQPTPKTGDVWVTEGTRMEYRVVGIDEQRGFYLIAPKADWDGGQWRGPRFGGLQEDMDVEQVSYVYSRRLPEEHLELKERPL